MSSSQHPSTPVKKKLLTASGLEYSPLTPVQPQASVKAESPSKLRTIRTRASHPSSSREIVPESPQTSPGGYPESEPDPSEQDDGETSEDDSSDEEMATLTFSGKADSLDPLLTHCRVKFLARPSRYETDQQKSAFIASHFVGPALDWLTQGLKRDKTLLNDFEAFTALLEATFQASDDTKKQLAEQKLRRLRQTGSAQNYALAFDPLVAELGYNDDAKKPAFLQNLKPEVRKQLAGQRHDTYESLRGAAIDMDESLFALREPGRKKSRRPGQPNKSAH